MQHFALKNRYFSRFTAHKSLFCYTRGWDWVCTRLILCEFGAHKMHIAHIGTHPVCACFCVFVCFTPRFRKQPTPDYLTVLLTLPEYPTIWLTSALWKVLFYRGSAPHSARIPRSPRSASPTLGAYSALHQFLFATTRHVFLHPLPNLPNILNLPNPPPKDKNFTPTTKITTLY